MSRTNKVNPDHYTMAGRLTADELARQRVRQGEQQLEAGRRGRRKPMPPWLANERSSGGDGEAAGIEPESAGLPRRRSTQKTNAVTPRKGSRPAPRQKMTGEAPGAAARKSTKAAGASGTPRAGKGPRSRASAARGASPQRAGKPGRRQGRTTGSATTRKAQKKR